MKTVFTLKFVAKLLEEDVELLEAIVYNEDNLSDGCIITALDGEEEYITLLTADGIAELDDMISDARMTAEAWHEFLDSFVDAPEARERFKAERHQNTART